MFNNIRSDLKAHGGKMSAPGFWVLLVYRFGRWRYGIRQAVLRKPFSLVYKVMYRLVQIVTDVELPCETVVGHSFIIDHGRGIVISGFASFGDNCRIRNGVVVGLRRIADKRCPRIGNNVDIGCGAKILGNITIGNNVAIGANAVVLCDVPDNSIAVGVPAIIKPRKSEGFTL